MVFNCRVFNVNDEEEAMRGAAEEKKQADERKLSKKTAVNGGKKDVPKAGNELKKADHYIRPAAIRPTAQITPNTPPPAIGSAATASQPPLPSPAVNQPENGRLTAEQEPPKISGRSPEIQLPGQINAGDDGNKRKLLSDPDSGQQKEGTGKLVLKMRLRCDCEGCVHKVRQIVKKFGGVEAVRLDPGSGRLSMKGPVSKERLVWYLEHKLKQEIEIVQPETTGNIEEAAATVNKRKDTGAQKKPAEDDTNGRRKAEEEDTNGNSARGVVFIQGVAPPAALLPVSVIEEERILPPADWKYGMPGSSSGRSGYEYETYCPCHSNLEYHRLYQNRVSDMFSDENANACSIM